MLRCCTLYTALVVPYMEFNCILIYIYIYTYTHTRKYTECTAYTHKHTHTVCAQCKIALWMTTFKPDTWHSQVLQSRSKLKGPKFSRELCQKTSPENFVPASNRQEILTHWESLIENFRATPLSLARVVPCLSGQPWTRCFACSWNQSPYLQMLRLSTRQGNFEICSGAFNKRAPRWTAAVLPIREAREARECRRR